MYEEEIAVEGEDTVEEISIDELIDLAFGMFTIFAEQKLEAKGNRLFALVEEEADILPELELFYQEFSAEFPVLAEPLSLFGEPADILSFYQYGEGIVPSKTTHTHWIQQTLPGTAADACGAEEAGKWLLFLPPAEIDDAWIKIRDATVAGELGIGAKVSTSRDNDASEKRVIYVFTKDWEDEADVMRVRDRLKELGFVDRIGYKRNLDTYAGEYREKGKRVTYYSV